MAELRPLRVGVQLPEVEWEARWPEYLAMARAAEEAGFDSIWLGDHLLYRGEDVVRHYGEGGEAERGPWEVWTLLAALAAVTSRVQLGPLVACASFHAPAMLAKMASTVDEVSGGRLVLGLGAGWNEVEYRAFGFPFDHRVSRFEESFEIVRRLVAGERVTYEGRFWQVEDVVLLPRPARRIPLMVGSNGDRMLSITLPHVDSWNCWYSWYGNTAEGFSELNARIDAAVVGAGRELRDVERSAAVLVALESGGRRTTGDDVQPIGPAMDGIAAHLRGLAEAGADEAILIVEPITVESIRALGEAIAILDG